MKNRSTLSKTVLLFVAFLLSILPAKAAIYTAVASGSFDAGATWGGTAPGSLLTTDVAIIPYGLTVSLTANESITGTASLIVNGTLNSSVDHAGLIMTGGNLSGGGTVNLDVISFGSLSSLSFTGSIVVNRLTSYGINITHSSNIRVTEKLHLLAGNLHFTTGRLELANGAMLEMGGGTFSAIGSGDISMDSSYNLTYLAPASPAGIEIRGPGLRDITINTAGRIRLDHDLSVNGLLKLTHGTLELNGHHLTFNPTANLSATGTGRIAASAASNIVVATASDLSGSLKFATGENTLNSLMLFMGHSFNTASLGTDVHIANTLTLSNGRLLLGAYDIHINEGAVVSGGSHASYVVTNGGGKLYAHVGTGMTVSFPVGTINDYSPITVTADAGSPSDELAVSTGDKVYVNGMSGMEISENDPMVKATWYVSGSTTLPINYTIRLEWNDNMHTKSFTPQKAYISHYTQGVWDWHSPSPATAGGGMYSLTRSGIRSLSPLRVAGNKTTFVTNTVGSEERTAVYPNPTYRDLHLSYAGAVNGIDIYNIAGTKVRTINGPGKDVFVGDLPAGNYFLSIRGSGGNITHKFTRQ